MQKNLDTLNSIDEEDEEAVLEMTKLYENYMKDESPFDFGACDCLPACSSIHYAAEMTQSEVETDSYLKANKIFDEDFEKLEKFIEIAILDNLFEFINHQI